MNAASVDLPPRREYIQNADNASAAVGEYLLKLLNTWKENIASIFRQESNANASWPPDDSKECFSSYFERPELAKQLALELAWLIEEIENDGCMFGGKEMYPHQLGQLKWLVIKLLEGGTSYLLEGAPGTGKTLVLGAIMEAITRLQRRGLMEGSVAYGTHKANVLAQQTFSQEDRHKRVLLPPNLSELKDECEYLGALFGKNVSDPLHREEWGALREERLRNENDPEKAMCALLLRWQIIERKPEKNSVLEKKIKEAALLLSNQTVLIRDIDESFMALLLSPREVMLDDGKLRYSGDLGAGIPKEFVENDLVIASKAAMIGNNDLYAEAKNENAKVLLMTMSALMYSLQHSTKSAISALLSNVEIVLVDEAKQGLNLVVEAILDARKEDSTLGLPLVIGASALSTTSPKSIAARPDADSYSPRMTIPEAIDAGVLPNVGVDVFPGSAEMLYESGTPEAREQLIAAHFATLEIPDTVDQYQPCECNSLMIVENESIVDTVRRLREEYESRGIPAIVVPFRANTKERKDKSNTQPPYSERIFEWMLDEPQYKDDKRVAKILVSGPESVADALSLTNLENVTIGTSKGVGAKTLMRIFGRLMHSNLHRGKGPDFRLYFRQGLYQGTKPEEMIFNLLKHEANLDEFTNEDLLEWTRLQVLHGKKGYESDVDRTKKMEKIHIPRTSHALGKRNLAEKTGEKTKGKEPRHPLPLQERKKPAPAKPIAPPPPMIVMTEKPKSDTEEAPLYRGWEKLEKVVVPQIRRLWGQAEVREQFTQTVLRTIELEVGRPNFIEKRWKVWQQSLGHTLSKEYNSAEDALEAVKRRFEEACRTGRTQ